MHGRASLDSAHTRSFAWGSREATKLAIAIDPVCGMEVQIETAQSQAEHQGATYCFCTEGCRAEFADDPDTYLERDYQPTGM